MRRSLARWIHGALRRAFGLLLAAASARHYSSHLMRGALLFYRAQALVVALRAWRSHSRIASRLAFAQMAGVLHQWQRTPVRARLAEAQSCITQLSFADSTHSISASTADAARGDEATNQVAEAEAQFAMLSAWVQWLSFCTRAERLQRSRRSATTLRLRTFFDCWRVESIGMPESERRACRSAFDRWRTSVTALDETDDDEVASSAELDGAVELFKWLTLT